MDDYVKGMRKMVMDGEMSIIMYIYHCGVHYGYKKCCISNYINLKNLGYSPALFMFVVLGSTACAGYVLCPMCESEWTGIKAEPQFDLTKPGVIGDIKKYIVFRYKP